MITKDDLLTSFGEVAEVHGCYFSKYVVATYVLYCCVRNAKRHDLAIASKNVDDPEFATSVVLNAPHHLSHDGPTIFEIPSNAMGSLMRWRFPAPITGF